MRSFVQRMVGAAKLNPDVYEEVEADRGALGQSAAVVVLSSLAAGIGALGYADPVPALLLGTLAALIGWLIWASLTWLIGTKLLPEPQTEADIGQLLRTIGFAATPGLFRVFGFIPGLGGLIVLAATVWMLAATVIAVRQALDYESTWRAVGVCVIGWLLLLVVQMLLLALILPPPAASPVG